MKAEHRRNDRKIFGDVIGNREWVNSPWSSKLLADLVISMSFVDWVEINHVAASLAA
jgi:hypothetical protein